MQSKFTINIENDPKFEATDTEFEAAEEVKESEHGQGGRQLAPGGHGRGGGGGGIDGVQ